MSNTLPGNRKGAPGGTPFLMKEELLQENLNVELLGVFPGKGEGHS